MYGRSTAAPPTPSRPRAALVLSSVFLAVQKSLAPLPLLRHHQPPRRGQQHHRNQPLTLHLLRRFPHRLHRRTRVMHQDQSVRIDLRQKSPHLPSIFNPRLEPFRASIHSPSPDASNRSFAAAYTFGSYSHVITRPTPFSFSPSAIRSVLNPENVPVSSTTSRLSVFTTAFKKSSTSTSALIESYMCQRSGCGHSGVGR